jgi:hypothetical protein
VRSVRREPVTEMTKMKGTEEMTNILDLADQALFLGERATGATSVIQCIWVYDRAIDIDGLRRFHHYLQRGRLARRIERSPLPFGRHRWVMGSDSSDIEFTQIPRPREEFDAWLTEQAHTPLDAEHGPGWRRDYSHDLLVMRVQMDQICDAVRSVVPESMWGEIVARIEEVENHSETLDVGTDDFDDDEPYDPTEFIEQDDEF